MEVSVEELIEAVTKITCNPILFRLWHCNNDYSLTSINQSVVCLHKKKNVQDTKIEAQR